MKFYSAEPTSFEKLSMKPIKRIVDPQLIDYLATNFPQNNEYSGKVCSLARFLNIKLYIWEPNTNRDAYYFNAVEEILQGSYPNILLFQTEIPGDEIHCVSFQDG